VSTENYILNQDVCLWSQAANLLAQIRWRAGVYYPCCCTESPRIRHGSIQVFQRYRRENCDRTFNDQTKTVLQHSARIGKSYRGTMALLSEMLDISREIGPHETSSLYVSPHLVWQDSNEDMACISRLNARETHRSRRCWYNRLWPRSTEQKLRQPHLLPSSSIQNHRSGRCRNAEHHRHPNQDDKEARCEGWPAGRPQECGRPAFINCRPWLWVESLQRRTPWKWCSSPNQATHLLVVRCHPIRTYERCRYHQRSMSEAFFQSIKRTLGSAVWAKL